LSLSPCTDDGYDNHTDVLDFGNSSYSYPIDDCAPSLGDVDLSVLGVDDLPLSPTAVEDFFGSWSV
jgi:hypothetical protein